MTPQKIEKIRFWFGRKAPRWIFAIAVFFRHIYKALKYPEIKKCFGELNPDKTFFVIRLAPPATGFLANYNYVLGYMKYAFDKGWIPVVDMENYGTLYQEEGPVNGTRNVWEYFFQQPFDEKTSKRYSLSEVYRSKNVVLAKADDQKMYDSSMSSDSLVWQHKMSLLIPFNKNMQAHVDNQLEKVLPKETKILGVPTRGSEQKKRVIGHAIPLNVDEMAPIIQKRCAEWDIDNIFVKAEEQETIDYLRKTFDNLYYTECERIRNFSLKKDVNASITNKKQSKSDNLKEYLTDIFILSKCTSLLGTENNGLYTAIVWNGGKFDHFEIIKNGVWK